MILTVESAQLSASSGEDRLVVTDHAVVALDGATAHDPELPAAGKYVDQLAHQLEGSIDDGGGLAGILRRAISCTTLELGLEPGVGTGPSSTVAAMQIYTVTNEVELLILGDSTVIVGWRTGAYTAHTDNRMSELDLAESREYRDRLKSGYGYDDQHREILRRLQIAERAHRNKPDGYWIAEADISAAYRALRAIYSLDDVDWVILATDGAFDVVPMLGIDWPSVAHLTSQGLNELLHQCHAWEEQVDPDGRQLPRAKRHDDKTIAVVRF